MSVSIEEAISLRTKELENLNAVVKDYPEATYIRGRLYGVDRFLPGVKPTNFVVDSEMVRPCLVYGQPEDECSIFVVESWGGRMQPVLVVQRLFQSHPELVLEVLRR